MSVITTDDLEVVSTPNKETESGILPEPVVSMVNPDEFQIELLQLQDEPLWDQSVATASGQGCISSPGGPSC